MNQDKTVLVNDRRSRGSRAKLQQDAGELSVLTCVDDTWPAPPYAHTYISSHAQPTTQYGLANSSVLIPCTLCMCGHPCRGRRGRRGAGVSQACCSQDKHALGSGSGCSAAAAEACRRSTQGDAVRRQ